MDSETMKDEYPDNDQRLAVCFSQWKNKKSESGAIEQRTFNAQIGIEGRGDGKTPKIVGHAAVFDVIGEGGWFREKVAPGAFANTIKEDDVRALFNHNPDFVIGRNRAGTLRMKEDEKGLAIEIDPPETQFARDLMISIGRGDISQMSFGFEILKEERQAGEGKDLDLFTLREVRLWDVSPVTYPFYKQTDVSVHSRQAWSDALKSTRDFKAKGWRVSLNKRKFRLIERRISR